MARQQQETPKPTAPPVPPEGPELLDVDGALKRLGGKRWIYARVLHQFISDCSHFVETMGHCLANQDRQGIARLTHKMKGATSQVGATALYTMTLELERAVARPSTDIAIENLIAFEKRIQQTVASINDFYSITRNANGVRHPAFKPAGENDHRQTFWKAFAGSLQRDAFPRSNAVSTCWKEKTVTPNRFARVSASISASMTKRRLSPTSIGGHSHGCNTFKGNDPGCR